MNPFLDLKSTNIIRIFNTVSHIIYAEMTGETKNTLRRVIYDPPMEELCLFDKELFKMGIDKYPIEKIEELFSEFYKIVVYDNEETDTAINLIFTSLVDDVDYILDRSYVKDQISNLYIFVPNTIVSVTPDDKEGIEKAIKVVSDIFFNILNGFAYNPTFRSGKKRGISFVSNNESITITDTLSKVFAHLILDAPYLVDDDMIKTIVDDISANSVDTTTAYIKIVLNEDLIKNIIRYIKTTS